MAVFDPAPQPVAGEIRPFYRPSIDGLRGIAILAVVLYHADASLLPGGFIGVDIFFVISGFLISTLIFKELEQGRFSFTDFYARRIRRIFPALILMMSASWIAALFLLTHAEFSQLGAYIFAGGAFGANFLQWRQIKYFDPHATLQPLMHLWSLGIEEQFYVLWPVLLVLLWKRNLRAVILSVLLASFVFNIWATPNHSASAFYLLPGRAWELLLGSLLALLERPAAGTAAGMTRSLPHHRIALPLRQSVALKDVGAPLALVLLAVGFTAINSDSQFPGWWALLPSVAAFLLIWAGEGAWINAKILAHPALVFVGLISYPLYIWHWPLLSQLRIAHRNAPTPAAIGAAVAAAVVLAILTWWLVERPLRASRRARGAIVAALCMAMAVISTLGLLGHLHLIQTERMAKDGTGRPSWDCSAFMATTEPGYEGCRVWGDPAATKTYVIWGDSFAGSWEAGAEALAKERGARLVQFMYFACPPLLGMRRIPRSELGRECESFDLENSAFRTIVRLRPSRIILAGRWSSYVDQPRWAGAYLTANPRGNVSEETSRAALLTQIPETLRRLTRIAKVLIIKGTPTLHATTEEGLVNDPNGFEPSLSEYQAYEAFPNAIIDQAARDIPGVTVMDPTYLLCDGKKCHAIVGGIRMYGAYDPVHLSDPGSLLFLPRLEALAK
jgi:peptidoglycan/LPS O-acetylase OafA/YrhL